MKCDYCNVPILHPDSRADSYFEDDDGEVFCSEHCLKQSEECKPSNDGSDDSM